MPTFYGEQDLESVTLIKKMQRFGFKLVEILTRVAVVDFTQRFGRGFSLSARFT
jgi:hypothetical protein